MTKQRRGNYLFSDRQLLTLGTSLRRCVPCLAHHRLTDFQFWILPLQLHPLLSWFCGCCAVNHLSISKAWCRLRHHWGCDLDFYLLFPWNRISWMFYLYQGLGCFVSCLYMYWLVDVLSLFLLFAIVSLSQFCFVALNTLEILLFNYLLITFLIDWWNLGRIYDLFFYYHLKYCIHNDTIQ